MPSDGISKGSEGEEDPGIHGHDPLKQKGSQRDFSTGRVTDVIRQRQTGMTSEEKSKQKEIK